MNNSDNQIADNLYELRNHGNYSFPFVCYNNHFSKQKLSYISLHWHPEVEIIYINKGSLELIVNEKKYIMKENDAMIINPLELHGMSMIEDCRWYAILFNPKIIYGFEDSIIKKKYFNNLPFHNIILDDETKEYVKSIIKSSNSNENNHELDIISKLFSMYYSLFKNINVSLLTSSSASNNSKVKKLLDYINDNYNQKIRIDDVSKELCICRSEVCKLFKEELHTTFIEYLTKLRIERAIQLLNSSEANITQISELVGFNSSSYFTETFKKFFKMSPLEYKNSNLGKRLNKS